MKTFFTAFAFVGSLVATQAGATTYSYQYTSPDAALSGTLTTSSTGSVQLIDTLSGTLNGEAVALAAPGSVPYDPTNTNLIYPGMTGVGYDGGDNGGYLDAGGIAFYVGADLWNLYYIHNSMLNGYELDNDTGAGYNFGTFTLSAMGGVPEPGVWMLLLAGVGMIGACLRVQNERRRESLATA